MQAICVEGRCALEPLAEPASGAGASGAGKAKCGAWQPGACVPISQPAGRAGQGGGPPQSYPRPQHQHSGAGLQAQRLTHSWMTAYFQCDAGEQQSDMAKDGTRTRPIMVCRALNSSGICLLAEGGSGGQLGLCAREGRVADIPQPAALHGGTGV